MSNLGKRIQTIAYDKEAERRQREPPPGASGGSDAQSNDYERQYFHTLLETVWGSMTEREAKRLKRNHLMTYLAVKGIVEGHV